ncbi:hypothetical protein ATANTOWER_009050 [Ataeniobius toweri]|uniref:Uncharacterized protein n=1 Tax=Ataeniobius toweri TaxID=208326 RepID=A0ABU7BYI9_9TELE|nr:hypothetical protein [Ataeniobius toweri]
MDPQVINLNMWMMFADLSSDYKTRTRSTLIMKLQDLHISASLCNCTVRFFTGVPQSSSHENNKNQLRTADRMKHDSAHVFVR